MIINDIIFNADLWDILTELKSQLTINGIELLGKIKDGPENIQVCCPYHNNGQEKRPSAGIKKDTGVFHCFACQETHSLPEVISYCFGKDDVIGSFGWQWLVKNFSTVAVEERKDLDLDYSRNNSNNRKLCFVSEEELNRYRYYHPYWEKRGIVDEEIIELFDLGFDKQSGCITFPVRDVDGNCLFVAKRSISTKFFNYPSGAKKPVYGLYELVSSEYNKDDDVFICESMIDCLLLWQAGYYALALNGLGNQYQMEQLRNLSVRKFILATDNDPSGKRARTVLKLKIDNKIFSEIEFPDDRKDIGECTQEEIENILDWEVFV